MVSLPYMDSASTNHNMVYILWYGNLATTEFWISQYAFTLSSRMIPHFYDSTVRKINARLDLCVLCDDAVYIGSLGPFQQNVEEKYSFYIGKFNPLKYLLLMQCKFRIIIITEFRNCRLFLQSIWTGNICIASPKLGCLRHWFPPSN